MVRKAMKFNKGKAQHHLLIDEFLTEMIRVREFGSEKYEPWDWLHGLEFSNYQDAIKRHLKDFNMGEDVDSESKRHHMAHIAISAMFLYTFQMTGAGVDDRHGVKAERILKQLRAEVGEEIPRALREEALAIVKAMNKPSAKTSTTLSKHLQAQAEMKCKTCENCRHYDEEDGLCYQPCVKFSHHVF